MVEKMMLTKGTTNNTIFSKLKVALVKLFSRPKTDHEIIKSKMVYKITILFFKISNNIKRAILFIFLLLIQNIKRKAKKRLLNILKYF